MPAANVPPTVGCEAVASCTPRFLTRASAASAFSARSYCARMVAATCVLDGDIHRASRASFCQAITAAMASSVADSNGSSATRFLLVAADDGQGAAAYRARVLAAFQEHGTQAGQLRFCRISAGLS